MHSTGDLVMFLGDFDGHVGRNIDGVRGGFVIGQMNLEGRMLLEFCLEMELCVSNMWFKREDKRKVTTEWEKMRQKLSLC